RGRRCRPRPADGCHRAKPRPAAKSRSLTAGSQPTRVPSSVANGKTAGAVIGFPVRSTPPAVNPPAPPPSRVSTGPVGAPGAPTGSAGAGTLTTSGLMPSGGRPAAGGAGALERVDTPALLSETHNGLPGLSVRPNGLTRLGSWSWATPSRSDTRLVCGTFP